MFPITEKTPKLWAVNSVLCSETITQRSYSCLTVLYFGTLLIPKKGNQF